MSRKENTVTPILWTHFSRHLAKSTEEREGDAGLVLGLKREDI